MQEDFQFGGATPDASILHQDHPAARAGVAQPFFILKSLADPLAVDVGHRVDGRAGLAQRVTDEVSSQAAVDEELRQRVGWQPG